MKHSPTIWMLWFSLTVLATAGVLLAQSPLSLQSPDGRIEVTVKTAERLAFSVSVDGRPVLIDSTVSLRIDGRDLGASPTLESTHRQTVDREIEPVVRQKAARIREHYNELQLAMQLGRAG